MSLGNEVDKVLVSEDTQRPEELTHLLRNLEADFDAINNRKRQAQARLAEITARVRSFGGQRIDPTTYNRICEEQVELKKELVELEKRGADLKAVRKELREDSLVQDQEVRTRTLGLLQQIAADQKQILRLLKSNVPIAAMD